MSLTTPPSAVYTIVPNGDQIALLLPYSSSDITGVTVMVVISSISLLAIVGLLGTIALSAFNTRSSIDQHLFVRTHVAAYFISLLLCDLMQAIGSILNAEWIQNKAVSVGFLCTLQAILKQTSDVGTALFSMIIAFHTFFLLVLEWKMPRIALWSALFGGWSLIATLVIAGPAAQDTAKRGPFFSISGYWCWISPTFPGARITLDYMIMFMSALLSLVLYILMYLRLRGNLKIYGGRMAFNFKTPSSETGINGEQAVKIAKQMLLYPLAYIVLISPIAASRFSDWSGHEVPFEVTVFSAAVFLCSGLVNVVLFTSTRRILPPDSINFRISKFSISKPTPLKVAHRLDGEVRDTYYEERKMVDVDMVEKAETMSYHNRSGSSFSSKSSLYMNEAVPLPPHADNRATAGVNAEVARGGHGADVPQDVRESGMSFDFRQTQQFPQVPPTARRDTRVSAVDSMYDYYGARESTLTNYYQYSGEQEPFPSDLAGAAKRFDQGQR